MEGRGRGIGLALLFAPNFVQPCSQFICDCVAIVAISFLLAQVKMEYTRPGSLESPFMVTSYIVSTNHHEER